jgi:hypothetical protein
MVGSYHNHDKHGHTREVVETLQHGGIGVLLVIGQVECVHQGPFSPSTHPS